jgi:hypothetical protein
MLLPPLPRALKERETKYEGDLKDMKKRVYDKLFNLWIFWATIAQNKDIAEVLNVVPDDKNSHEFLAKMYTTNFIDTLGHILSETLITEEMEYLTERNQIAHEETE